ncbi:MAG: SpaA isopeptide-forming pilin-related protein, partial [Oscillospiraceae bacterium]|nr:SpaA isopeptide-forming pilin-related protein [Oscillospiraceae bacterium]
IVEQDVNDESSTGTTEDNTKSSTAENGTIVDEEEAGNHNSVNQSSDIDAAASDDPDESAKSGSTVKFEADSFSVYAIVYTVDFHWSVDGREYSYSIVGGSPVTLSELLPIVGIVLDDDNTEIDEVAAFLESVESVTFSNPELIWVEKAESETTIGAIEDARKLDVQYSAQVTEEQKIEYRKKTVQAGDWALICVQAFNSQESLTIHMADGTEYVIKVTDANVPYINQLSNGQGYILYINVGGQFYALDGSGNTQIVEDNDLDSLPGSYLWTYDTHYEHGYDACAWHSGGNYLDIYNYNKTQPIVSGSGSWTPITTLVPYNGGFIFRDLNPFSQYNGDYRRYIYLIDNASGSNHNITAKLGDYPYYWTGEYAYSNAVTIYVYKQGTNYSVKARSANEEYGHVKYNNDQITSTANPTITVETLKNDYQDKTVRYDFEAVPANGYKFAGWTVVPENSWDTNARVTNWGAGHSSSTAVIRPTVNRNNITLVANFEPEKLYTFTVKTNDSSMGTVGGKDSNGGDVNNQNSFQSISGVVIDGSGKNAYEITAAQKPLYEFLRWELKGSSGSPIVISQSPTISAKEFDLTEDNMTLTAVFQLKANTEIDDDDINGLLDKWKNEVTGDFAGVDKTAHVKDYDNRIYEIDLMASSGKWIAERSITLDFITDTSRSMYFPANLDYAIHVNNDDEELTQSRAASTYNNLRSWLSTNGVPGNTYYVISKITNQDDTATMYAVTHDDDNDRWVYIDASYHRYQKEGTSTHSAVEVPNGLAVNSTRELSGIIYKSSDAPDSYVRHYVPGELNTYWSRLDYLYKAVMTATNTLKTIDPNANVSLTTFNKGSENEGSLFEYGTEENDIYRKLKDISPLGGTRQDKGLYTSRTGTDVGRENDYGNDTAVGSGSAFENNSDHKQFAIIVTDGAPNGGEWGNTDGSQRKTIYGQAKLLKDITDSSGNNLVLMTLGVGSDFVGSNKAKFDGLASESKYAENANNGGQIVDAIKNLVQNMLVKANLFGTVSDTLDPAFYPVDEDYNPVKANVYIDKDGTEYNTKPDVPCYMWTKNGEAWTITYYNQTFKWPEKDGEGNIIENGWKQTFYAKAKEDFLGGNTIETNADNVTFTATHTIRLDDQMHEVAGSKTEIKKKNDQGAIVSSPIVKNDVPSPHVNIKQLTLDENNTEWKVYIDMNVNPLPQIKELYNNIKIEKVVDSDTNNMITSKDAMLFEPGIGTEAKTFFLKEITGNVDSIDWSKLTGSPGHLDFIYTRYDHTTGVIRLTLTKEGSTADFGAHQSSTNLTDKETYVLTAQFLPYSIEYMQEHDGKDEGGVYHTTADQSPGTELVDGKPSENKHVINVFARALSITKTNETFKQSLTGAEFAFYRPATTEEINAGTGIKTINGGKYVLDQNAVVDDSGIVYIDGIKALSYEADTVYYLIETKAPDGYNMRDDPMPVTLKISNSYTSMPVADGMTPVELTERPSGLYNWTQKAALSLDAPNVMRTTAAYDPDNPETDLTNQGITPSSIYEVMYYRIANNPGFELPATGGPGTNFVYLLGILLTGIAGAGLLMRKRKRTA